MDKQNSTIKYFGKSLVEKAVYDYFLKHGISEDVRDQLMEWESTDSDEFFEIVSTFVEKNS